MKEWNKPVVEEVKIAETQYGGDVKEERDNVYQDENEAWHVTYPKDSEKQS